MVRRSASILLAFAALALAQAQPAAPLPVPAETAQEKARLLIEEVLGEEFRLAKSAGDKVKLADVVLQQAREAKGNDALRFVLTETAIKLTAQGGDVRRALTLTEEFGKAFAVDLVERKQRTLFAAAESVPTKEAAQGLVDLLAAAIQEALDADNFESAAALSSLAETAARKANDEKLLEVARRRVSDVAEVRKSFEQIKIHLETLKTKPDDPSANLEAGRYYALFKGRWDKGLPMLAKGGDVALKDAAKLDQSNPENFRDRLALADTWWTLAQANKDAAQLAMQRRAVHWYGQALPDLAGLNRTKASRRSDLVRVRLAGELGDGPALPVGELKKYELQDEIKSVAISPDGRFAAAGNIDSAARVWDVAADKEDKILRGHAKQVWGIAWHPGGRWIATSSWDGTARLWEARTGAEVRRFSNRVDLNGIAFSRDGNLLLAGSDDRSAILWNAQTGDEIRKFPGHSGFVYAVAFSPDGKAIATGSGDKTARVWDLQTGQELRVLDGHSSGVYAVAFTPDSKYLISAGDGYAHVWDLSNGKELRRFEGHAGLVTSMALSYDGRRLLTGGDDKMIRLWDVASGKMLHQYAGHRDTVTSVAFAADGRKAVSGSLDRTMRVWGLPR